MKEVYILKKFVKGTYNLSSNKNDPMFMVVICDPIF
jgi:hypothetical protein